jgi:hypothetical protein
VFQDNPSEIDMMAELERVKKQCMDSQKEHNPRCLNVGRSEEKELLPLRQTGFIS